VTPAAKVIVSPSFATLSAARNEPGPLSLVFVTVMVIARAGIAIAQNSAVTMAATLTEAVNLLFIFL
jgi:hypothetical protein